MVVWIVAIILFFLAAMLWLAALLLKWPLWIPIAGSVVALLVVVGLIVFRRLRAAARAAALERELLKQAANQADRVRPDRRPEILELQAQMKAAIAALKRTKLGARSGVSALYALPWYVIVGPPAAGKTTALEKSGLSFTAPPGSGGPKVRGTAGTRNCDWWFSRSAIILDTAGRFATEEEDQEEWFAFLDTVRRFRPERPLDGIVVALSVADVLNASEPQIDELAHKLRARVDEMLGRLEMVLPIYLMFTKTDLIAGFVEYWADLNKNQRAQAWGATFALDDERLSEPARAFETEFEVLVRVLHARMLERLGREQLPEVRARVLEYPVEFQALKAPLARFVEELCRPNPYSETPILRGFYFSSGTQTGRPIERVLGNMMRGFDLRLGPGAGAPTGQPQSYFVTELFEKVIFPDRNLAVRSSSRLRRLANRQALIAACAVLLMLIALVPAMISYAQNRDLIQSSAEDVAEAMRLPRDAGDPAPRSLDVLLGRVRKLEQASAEFRVPGWWGPRAAPELQSSISRLYLDRLRQVVDVPIQEQLTADVRSIGSLVRTDAENFRGSYDDLKLYLMLTNPQRLDLPWAKGKLSEVWARTLQSQPGVDHDKLKLHSGYYLDGLKANPSWAWKADPAIIAQAQGRLAQQPIDDLRYGWLVDKAKGVPPIKPEKIFFGASAEYVTWRENVEVPGLYTALGWQKVRDALASPDTRLEIERWVLGQTDQPGDAAESSVDGVRDLYFQRYGRAWIDFLNGLEVKAPEDMETAIRELRVLTETDGPYVRLFRALSTNMTLELESPTLLDKAVDKGKELAAKAAGQDAGVKEREISPVEKQFSQLLRFGFGEPSGAKGDSPPSGLNQYLAQLSSLEVALSQLAESKAEPGQEFASELGRTASAVQRLLAGLDSSMRVLIEPLLMNPIRGSRAGVFRAGDAALDDRWRKEVWEPWNATLAGRYPFADVATEASVAEFAEFFRPQTGILWRFFEKDLSSRLERSGNAFVPRPSPEPVAFRPDFLKCLAYAQEISDAVFGGGPMPQVPFGVNIQPAGSRIAEIALKIDGQAVVYRNEPERWQPAQWPGKGPQRGAALQVKASGFTDEIPRDGEFGLFRLLTVGGIKPLSNSSGTPILVATWTLTRPGEPPVTIQIRPSKSVHPFSRDFFRRLRCPPEMMPKMAAAAP